jgi:Glucodextranase, domain B
MKISKQVWVMGAGLFVSLNLLHAQLSLQPVQAIGEVPAAPPDSIVAVTADAYGLSQIAPEDLPPYGTYWLVGPNGLMAPLPCPPMDLSQPIYAITDNIFLVDGTGGAVAATPPLRIRMQTAAMTTSALAAAVDAEGNQIADLIERVQDAQMLQMTATMFGMDFPSPMDGGGGILGGDGGSGYAGYSFDTNQLWLEITNVSNGLTFANLHNGTNQVYSIWSTTNLATTPASWQVEMELWPTDSVSQPFSLQNNNRQNLFLRAEDWTGVDSDGDGIPDWWAWLYWGTVNVTDTNLDYSGNRYTFARDYSNSIAPRVFAFTNLEVTNHYVNTSQPVVQLGVEGGPYYVATLIDDNNFLNAVWNNYSGSTVTVNLGTTEGWHDVWIGLRGHADDPTDAIWREVWLYLELTPPEVVLTSLTNSTISVPYLQLTGYSPVPLTNISYDLSNAAGTATNRAGYLYNQNYDLVHQLFTTNYFQCYDVPVTNGANVITLYATDVAGNTAILTTNILLDYPIDHTAPALTVIWPADGTTIGGTSFIFEGQVDDPTASISATIIDANGNPNTVAGSVDRDGTVWVENLPLAAGANTLKVTATDAAGNVSSTNLTVYQGSVLVTVAPLDSGEMNLTSVMAAGTVSDNTVQIYVNGVEAYVFDDGTWEAYGAPVSETGPAVFHVVVYPAADNGGGDGGPWPSVVTRAGMVANDQPVVSPLDEQLGKTTKGPTVQVVDFHRHDDIEQWYDSDSRDIEGFYNTQTNEVVWQEGTGGFYSTYFTSDLCYAPTNWTAPYISDSLTNLPADYDGANAIYGMAMEHYDGWAPTTPWGPNYPWWKIDAHTALKTGGELVPGRQNLYLVKVQVQDMNGHAVPVSQVQVPGWTLLPDADNTNWGDFLVSAPDQATVAMTPQTTAVKDYTWSFQVTKVGLFAITNGTPIDLATTTPEFCVGQQVTFALNVPLNQIVDMVGHWTLPDKYVNQNLQYTPFPSSSPNYYMNDWLLQNTNQTSCWFVNGSGGQVTVSLNLQLKNGQYVSVAENGNFTVYRPQANLIANSATIGSVTVAASGANIPAAKLTSGDVIFDANITSTDFSGQANWVQLINRQMTCDGFGSLFYLQNNTDGSWLDNDPFYNTVGGAVGTEATNSPVEIGASSTIPFGTDGAGDQPSLGILSTSFISLTDSFKTYLVFNPDPNNAANIWVTLGRVDWGWSGYAAFDIPTIKWLLITGSTNAPTYINTDEFPVWPSVYHNSK